MNSLRAATREKIGMQADYVTFGAGSAGCVLASEDPSARVVRAGKRDAKLLPVRPPPPGPLPPRDGGAGITDLTRDTSGVPQRGSHRATTGRRTRGYLPAGRNWKLVIDDEFDGPDLNTNRWQDWYPPGTVRTANGGMYQDNRRALSFVNGHMVLAGFDATGLPGNPDNLPGTGGIISRQTWGPGYYEARVKGGSAWAGFWTEGMGPDCSPITAGFEADIFEMNPSFAPHGQNNVHWGGYGDCHQSSGTWINADPCQFYVFGMDWSTERGLTFYMEGQETFSLPSATATNAANIIFSIESSGDPGNPMEVDYFRYYTDEGPAQ